MKLKYALLCLIVLLNNSQSSFSMSNYSSDSQSDRMSDFSQRESSPECMASGDFVEVQSGGRTLEAALLLINQDKRHCWITAKKGNNDFDTPLQIAFSQITAKKDGQIDSARRDLLLWQLSFLLASNSPR